MSMELKVDFSGIEEAIGLGQGIADGAQDPRYIDGLINAAHNVASLEFDLDMAATAGITYLSHVYEFGTVGITRGDPKFSDPTAQSARLWSHTISGKGNTQNIGFAFRPAVVPNPEPTPEFTGVEQEVLDRLSGNEYVFWNKAAIVEYGATVHIRPKEKKVNFVPFYGKPSWAYPGRTHIFRPIEGKEPMESNPGDESGMTGSFTKFWMTWWKTRGAGLMDGTASIEFNKDVAYLMERYSNPSRHNFVSVMRYNTRGRVYNRRRYYKKRMLVKALERDKVKRN